jgi:PAS domain S-box-containing protein
MRDLAVFVAVAVVLFVLGWATGAWQWLHDALQDAVGEATDELYGALAVAAVVLAGLSIRRSRQASVESIRRAQAEERFRAVVEEVPAITYTWDPTRPAGTVTVPYVSPQIETVLGFTQDEWTSNPMLWIEHLHPEDRDRVVSESDRTDRTGEPFAMEYRIFAKDGREVWLRDESVVVARDPGGRPAKVQGVMFDITPQKRAEAALQEAENRYRTMVERVPAVSYVWDSADRPGEAPAAYISPQIETLLGFSAASWTDDPQLWASRLHPDDLPEVLAAWDRATADGGPFAAEYRVFAADGTPTWIRDEAVPVAVGDRGRPLYQGVMFDITEQRATLEQLRRTEDRYRSLVERLPVVTYLSDMGREPDIEPFRYIGPGIEQLTGYTQEEWIGDIGIWRRALHPADRDRVLEEADRTDASGERFDMEYRFVRKDGMPVWVHDTSEMVERFAPGERGVWQGVYEDITERKHAESRLAAAEARFRTLVEQIPAITYIEDRETGATIYISPQIQPVMGYSPEEWIADPSLWEARLHPDDRERVIADNASDTGDIWRVDYRSIARDGRVVWLHNDAQLIRDEEGNPRYWQGVVFDITERMESEERLREAEARYRSLVEQLPAVVYINAVDDTSTASYISPQYERLLGFTPEERIADPEMWLHQLHPDDLERVQAESLRTNETGDPFECEYRMITKDGSVIWLRDHAFLVGGEDGGPSYWQGVLFDITSMKHAEEALSRRDVILEATAFAAGRFLNEPSWTDVIGEVLEHLGEAARASRAYVFQNERDADGALASSGRFEWAAEGVDPTFDAPYNQHVPYARGFERWERMLGAGEVIHGATRAFPESERGDLLGLQGILSMVVMPITVGDEWWGYIGFDHCAEERQWHQTEIDALTVAANTLGAAIGRERAEQRITETEARYRSLVEQIPAITYIEEPGTGRVIYVSPQLETVLGYRREDLQLDRYWASIHPEDRERVQAEDDRTDATGEPYRVEYRQQAKDGRWLWIRDEAVLVHDERGNPLYWQGVRFDITAQKEAEQQVREAEEKYRTLIETVPAVTYIDTVSEPVQAIYVSPQIETMLGFTPEEWVGDPDLWWDHLDPDFLPQAREAVTRHASGEPFDVEYRFRAKDGEWRWIRDQALIVSSDDESVPGFSQGVMVDITDEKLAEEQLRDAEQRFRAIVEHIPAVVYLDPLEWPAETLYVSPELERMLGIDAEEWARDVDSWEHAIHPDDREAVVREYLEFLQTEGQWSREYRFVARDGRLVWVRDEASILRDEHGRPTFVQGVWFDITERMLAEEALRESERREREAAERLRSLDEMKNTFLAAVSHELRSPLTSILGLSLTLERHHELEDADREDLLERLSTNARKLDRLLKDLLDIDRLNRGIVAPQYRLTDVGALARRAADSLDSLADRRIEVETSPVVIDVDPAKVERIVENLLVNAARHTEDDRRIWLRVAPSDGGVLIAVEDDGAGVPAELRDAIFEPFRQGPTISSHSPGTGIGLSLVARFAELHGGRAWVEERDGGGASFRVFLPGGPAGEGDLDDTREGEAREPAEPSTGRYADAG